MLFTFVQNKLPNSIRLATFAPLLTLVDIAATSWHAYKSFRTFQSSVDSEMEKKCFLLRSTFISSLRRHSFYSTLELYFNASSYIH